MIPGPITIRRAEPQDAPAIAAVHVASWRTTYPGIVAQAYIDGLSVDERTAAWDRRLRGETTTAPTVLVASSADEIVGFISGGAIRAPESSFDAELHAIYLLVNAQRMGIGRRLVREWATMAGAQGFHAAVVRVLAANPARHFYERLGARYLRDDRLVIAGCVYPEIWYGWDDLGALTA